MSAARFGSVSPCDDAAPQQIVHYHAPTMRRQRPLEPPDPIPALKRQLAGEIRALLADHHQFVAAMILGVDQPRMSDIQRGRLERFSLEKLIRLLAHINCRVAISIVSVGRPRIR